MPKASRDDDHGNAQRADTLPHGAPSAVLVTAPAHGALAGASCDRIELRADQGHAAIPSVEQRT